MLFTQKSEIDIHEMSPLALAFVGDAVLELLVRARLVGTTRLQPNRLHTVATHYVSAHAQNLAVYRYSPMYSDAGGEIQELVTQYLEGRIDTAAFLKGVDQKVRMMMMEGN